MPPLNRSCGSLLKTVNGRRRDQDADSRPMSMAHQIQLAAYPSSRRDESESGSRSRRDCKSTTKSSKPVLRNPSPLHSSADEDALPTDSEKLPVLDSSDDELNSPGISTRRNADMKKTAFTTSARTTRRRPSPFSKASSVKERILSTSQPDSSVDELRSDVPTRDSSLSEASDEDRGGFLKTRRAPVAKYGKKAERVRNNKERPKLARVQSTNSPEKPRAAFFAPPGSSPPVERSRPVLKARKDEETKEFDSSDESDEEIRKLANTLRSSQEQSTKAEKAKKAKEARGAKTKRPAKKKRKRDSTSNQDAERSEKPRFQAFASFDDDLPILREDSPPKTLPLEDLGDMSDLEGSLKQNRAGAEPQPDEKPVCPWCGEPVTASLLKEFAKERRMNVRMQTKFCKMHKKSAARSAWEAKEYPTIDWRGLPKRLAEHDGTIRAIIEGKPTHYRNLLAERIAAGTGRKLRDDENLNPGYYGPRGFNIMCDYVLANFSDVLRDRAVVDRVVSGRGTVAFIQAVLVADLAVELIKEDMHVGGEKAVEVLEESKAIGDLLCEDAGGS